ncbi:MAG TPA: DUF2075 domain-containing protein [Ignavibacteria bacterium]
MNSYFYTDSISNFLTSTSNEILGELSQNSQFSDDLNMKISWQEEIKILKKVLPGFDGSIFFEYSIPRMGRRIDVVLIIENVIFVLEFKIGEKDFLLSGIDQVWDYALDLKNFHETSHEPIIAPILIATNAKRSDFTVSTTPHNDNLLFPIKSNEDQIKEVIENVLKFADGENINPNEWSNGRYSPTPTIIEAALSLYNNHSVADISRNDADAINLSKTSEVISQIIQNSKTNSVKAICFVTGVPGAGKTLVGLDIATKQLSEEKKNRSVYLSGNGPLVAILREVLTRDKVKREKMKGNKVKKGKILGEVKLIIQNVHNYRDEYLRDQGKPFDNIAIFDEAQRAWNKEQTSFFMKRKKGIDNFDKSESEFLISCLDRHKDWAVIICLVGGGQEIYRGEAGIGEWIDSINRSFPHWKVYISNRLSDSEYAAGNSLKILEKHNNITLKKELHLSVSMRSFRAENLSLLVKNIIDINIEKAPKNYQILKDKYPIVITRDLLKAKKWLKEKARGSERYGMVVSSQAYRLKPYAMDVRSPMDPIHWFLDGKNDVRSSYYLEDIATEFHIQGLELDWSCVAWDADLRFIDNNWDFNSFVGSRWQKINKNERKQYQKNAYRVLLTRARQGMVIFIPPGDVEDPTRNPDYYKGIYEYLKNIGFEEI